MKASRTKQMASVASLLMALVVLASGCSGVPSRKETIPVPALPPDTAQAQKFSSMKLVTDNDFEGWNSMAGEYGFRWSDADKASMEKNAGEILEILTQRHPEFTVEGFKPTKDILDSTIATELKPLTVSTAWPKVADGWMKEIPTEDGKVAADDPTPLVMNPFLTNQPEIFDSSDYPDYKIIRSWKSKDGEKCSPSSNAIFVSPVAISATTRPEGNTFDSAYPLITGKIDLSIPCKEGGRLKVEQLGVTLQLKKENSEWLLNNVNIFTGAGNTLEK